MYLQELLHVFRSYHASVVLGNAEYVRGYGLAVRCVKIGVDLEDLLSASPRFAYSLAFSYYL